jgi:protein O-mannosyl-transferase
MRRLARYQWTAGWLLLLALAYFVYRPGLSGGFQFDDYVNLPSLGAMGPIDDVPTLLRYLTSGTADPTGRPLALLSFLIDAQDWPADASRFLRTNILLHLLNGSLLLALIWQLERVLQPGKYPGSIALLGAGLWLLHPLLLSTTLYVVQREAMLAATFTLVGLLLYLRARTRFRTSGGAAGLGAMAAAVVGGTAAATLCKANGILLPLLVLVLEATVLRLEPIKDDSARTRLRRFHWWMLVLPSLVIAAYLASFLPGWNQLSNGRDWTIGERAMTQGRAMVDYLRLLAIPSSMSTGLYNDGYAVSKSLFDPPATFACLVAVAGLTIAGLQGRNRYPALATALLFFFAGHLLESTLLPLELYFEHRNYLPSLLLFWPLARALAAAPISPLLRHATALALIALVSITTYQRATLWGQPERMALLWAERNPTSSRSQSVAATAEIGMGRPQRAATRLYPLWKARPRDLQLGLNYISAACSSGGLRPGDKELAQVLFASADIGTPIVRNWLERAITIASERKCPGIELETVTDWIEASRERSPSTSLRSAAPLLAMLALEKGDLAEAVRHLRTSLDVDPTPENAAGQVALLASRGHFREALGQLDHYEAARRTSAPKPGWNMTLVHAWVLERQDYWPRELAILRSRLHQELKAEATHERSTR